MMPSSVLATLYGVNRPEFGLWLPGAEERPGEEDIEEDRKQDDDHLTCWSRGRPLASPPTSPLCFPSGQEFPGPWSSTCSHGSGAGGLESGAETSLE